jgi:hypothetical protein
MFIAFLAVSFQAAYRVYEKKKRAGKPLPHTDTVSACPKEFQTEGPSDATVNLSLEALINMDGDHDVS